MNKEILTLVDVVSNERRVSKEVIFEAVEAALVSATIKLSREEIAVRVYVDRNTGDYETFRTWLVIDDQDEPPELLSEKAYVRLGQALEKEPHIKVGSYLEEKMPSVQFGRIAAQTAKQVIVQKVREAERKSEIDIYGDQVGTVIRGLVKRIVRTGVILDLGADVEGIIPRDHIIPRESVRVGDRIRAYLMRVEPMTHGPQLFFSRTANEFLVELFKIEVPEISEAVVKIMSTARDPGARAKIAVLTNDPRLDPIGACVGMRGSRVQAVCNDLAGERIDIILWNEDPAQFVINALAPAQVSSISVDEEAHAMDIAANSEQLSIAIGRGGQNIRLASELTGWRLNLMSSEEAEVKNEAETSALLEMFKENLAVDEEVALILVQEQFTSLEEVAYVPESEMFKIDEFDEALVRTLRARARDALVTKALMKEQQLDGNVASEDLLKIVGSDSQLIEELLLMGVSTAQDLADCAIDDLLHITSMTEEQAGNFIMTARAPLFNNADRGDAS